MEDIADLYIVERLEQLRVLADPLRMRILEQLTHQPRTISQLGVLLGETTNKVHYHVHELERVDIIKLVEKRERGGFLEKYYRAVAKEFQVTPNLLRTSAPTEVRSVIEEIFSQPFAQIKQVVTSIIKGQQPRTISLTSEVVWLTEEEKRELERQVTTLLAPFLEQRPGKGTHLWRAHFIMHTFAAEKKKEQESEETEHSE